MLAIEHNGGTPVRPEILETTMGGVQQFVCKTFEDWERKGLVGFSIRLLADASDKSLQWSVLGQVLQYEASKALNFLALVCEVGRLMEIGPHAKRFGG